MSTTDDKKKTIAKKPKVVEKSAAKPVDKVMDKSVDKSGTPKKTSKTKKDTILNVVKPVVEKKESNVLSISPNKIKNIISNNILNKEIFKALLEIKDATPKSIIKKTDAGETKEEYAGLPLSGVSADTKKVIKAAELNYISMSCDSFVREKLSKLTSQEKETYKNAKKTYKSGLPDGAVFDLEKFNKHYDTKFYAEFDKTKVLQSDNEWKSATERISKLKNRFSNTSRIILSMLCEHLMSQIVKNAIDSCVDEKKKSVQISHLYTAKLSDTPLMRLLSNLDIYRTNKSYDETSKFAVTGLQENQQFQFKFVVNELFMKFVTMSEDGKPTLSISKQFKNYCSALLCDFIMRIGVMLLTEIEYLDVKTVNDCTVNTVINQYYNVCNVDFTSTDTYLTEFHEKYCAFTKSKKKTAASA